MEYRFIVSMVTCQEDEVIDATRVQRWIKDDGEIADVGSEFCGI